MRRYVDKRLLVLLGLWFAAASGCGNASAEQAAIKKIRDLDGSVEFQGKGIEVSFRNAKITDDDLACLSGLQTVHQLNLENTKITDAGIKHLIALPRLDYVRFGGSAVTTNGVKELRAKFPKAEIYQ